MERIVPIFRVRSAEVSVKWFARLGFVAEGVHQFADGFPRYMFLKRGDTAIHLSEHSGDAPFNSLVYFYVSNLQEIAQEFGVQIMLQPWGNELEITDPDDNRIRCGKAE